MSTVRIGLTALFLAAAAVGPAGAWTVGAGYAGSDVGLHENGDGVWAGVGRRTPLRGAVDLAWSLDYVQKRGAQPMTFSDPVDGFLTDEARVTLHFLQPAVFLGATLDRVPLRPRLYVGAAYGLKMGESWNDFPGIPSDEFAYEDSDFVGQIGLNVAVGPVELDARYMKGFGARLIADETARGGLKAENDLPGVDPADIGARLKTFTLGLLFTFP